jgi:tRNA-intron endonuclease
MVENFLQASDEIAVAELVQDRGIVWEPHHGTQLYASGYFGQPVGIRKPKSSEFDKPLELSLIECAYLTEIGRLTLHDSSKRKTLKLKDIIKLGKSRADDFEVRYKVYTQLRSKGYIVRPGLKFGTDFAVYERGPGKDHAPFLVHVISQKKGVVPLDIVRAGRLATSVRKKFIIATVKENGDIVYYSFVWHRP